MNVMYGFTDSDRDAGGQLHTQLAGSRVGMRWERIVRSHVQEVDALMAVHPDVRRHIGEALYVLADAGAHRRALDDETIGRAVLALDDLQRLGGFELKRTALGLREELTMARGRSIDEVLAS